MKKILFAIAFGALIVAACNKETEIENEVDNSTPVGERITLRASGEAFTEKDINGTSTKGSLDVAGNFLWADGDQIGVRLYKGTAATGTDIGSGYGAWDAAFALDSGYDGQSNGQFSSTTSIDEYVHWGYAAFYPKFSNNVSNDNGNVYFELKKVYENYVSGTCLMPMVANPGGGNLDSRPADISFKHVGAGIRVTLKDVPASANQASLTVAGKNIVNGDVNTAWYGVNPANAGTDAISATDGADNTVYLKFATASGPRDITFIFPLPTVDLSGGITLKLYYGDSYTEFWSKTAGTKTPLPALGRGDLLDLPDIPLAETWKTLGQAKYADYWLQGIKGVIEDLWDVTVQRNVSDPQQYRIVNPYGKGLNMLQTSTHDDYFYFTINSSTGAVSFTDHITGVLHNGGDQNYKLKYAETDKNMIVLGDKDTPKVLQFSPNYVNANNESWNWPRKGLPYLIRLVMPDYVSAYSSDITVTSDASSLAATFSAGSSAKVSLYLSSQSYPTYIEANKTNSTDPTSISSVYWTNKVNGNTISYSGANIASQSFSSGPLYLCYVTMDSASNTILTLGTKVIYFIAPSDVTTLIGSYSFSAIQALFHYYRKAWIDITSTNANSLVLAVSDDPIKGNVKLTNIFGFGCDGSTSSFVVNHKVSDGLGWNTDQDSDLTGSFTAGNAVYGKFASGSLDFPNPEESAFMTYDGTKVYVGGVYFSGGVSYSNEHFGFSLNSDNNTATLTANPVSLMTLTFDDNNYNADHGIVYVTNNSSFNPTALVATRSLQ